METAPQAPGDPNHQSTGNISGTTPPVINPAAEGQQPPVGPVAAFERGPAEPTIYPPAPVAPAPANQVANPWRRRGAAIVAGVVAIGTIVYGAYKLGTNHDDKASASPLSPATAGTLGVGSESSSVDTTGNTLTVTSSPETTAVPETLVTVGNINPTSPENVSPTPTPDTFDVWWGTSGTIHSQELAGPGNHTPTEQGSSALSMVSEVMSANLGYSLQLMPHFTNDPDFANFMTTYNNAFLNAYPDVPNQQLVFFDDKGNPAKFQQTSPNPNGNLTIQLTKDSGPVYVQRISSDEWGDPSKLDPSKAVKLTRVAIDYQTRTAGDPNATHMFVEAVNIFDFKGAILTWQQIAAIPFDASAYNHL